MALKEPITADRKFEDVVKSALEAAVLVLVLLTSALILTFSPRRRNTIRTGRDKF